MPKLNKQVKNWRDFDDWHSRYGVWQLCLCCKKTTTDDWLLLCLFTPVILSHIGLRQINWLTDWLIDWLIDYVWLQDTSQAGCDGLPWHSEDIAWWRVYRLSLLLQSSTSSSSLSSVVDGWCGVVPSCWRCCTASCSPCRRTRHRRPSPRHHQTATRYRRPLTRRWRRHDAAAPAAGGPRTASADDSCPSRWWRHKHLLLLMLARGNPVGCTASARAAVEPDQCHRDMPAALWCLEMSTSSLYTHTEFTQLTYLNTYTRQHGYDRE